MNTTIPEAEAEAIDAMSENDIRTLNRIEDANFPEPGEVAHPGSHAQTLKEIEETEKEPKELGA